MIGYEKTAPIHQHGSEIVSTLLNSFLVELFHYIYTMNTSHNYSTLFWQLYFGDFEPC